MTVSTSGGSSTLGVGGVGEEEEGEYLCLAVNSLGSASSESAQLTLACESYVWGTEIEISQYERERGTNSLFQTKCFYETSFSTSSFSTYSSLSFSAHFLQYIRVNESLFLLQFWALCSSCLQLTLWPLLEKTLDSIASHHPATPLPPSPGHATTPSCQGRGSLS